MKLRKPGLSVRRYVKGHSAYEKNNEGSYAVMDFETKKVPVDVQKTLDYYGGSLDDRGEPDEAPEEESAVTLPTPEEEEQSQREWAEKVSTWRRERGERS